MPVPEGREVVMLPEFEPGDATKLRGQGYDKVTGEVFELTDLTAEFDSYQITIDDEASITLPAGTKISISGTLADDVVHTGGVFTFASDVPGLYLLIVDAFPKRIRRYQIEVTV
jgi:hypothetical protein